MDEEQIYEAMGFKATDEGIAGADGPPEILVLEIPPEVEEEMDAAAGNVPNKHSVHATSSVTAEQGNVECTDDACSSPEHTKSDDVVIDCQLSQYYLRKT